MLNKFTQKNEKKGNITSGEMLLKGQNQTQEILGHINIPNGTWACLENADIWLRCLRKAKQSASVQSQDINLFDV